jgi:hypothetical protein
LLDKNGFPVEPDMAASNAVMKTVGILDLSEVAVQSLLTDASRVTFTLCERAVPDTTNEGNSRVSRGAYYSILAMDDSDMRNSYMIKPAEQYRLQLEEDERLENFWQKYLAKLPKD